MFNPYEILKLDKDTFNQLSEEEKVIAVVDAYYKIVFDAKSRFDERIAAERAYSILTKPNYEQYFEEEEQVGKRLR